MDNLLGVVIVLILLAAILVPFLSVLFSRRYPRETEADRIMRQRGLQDAAQQKADLDAAKRRRKGEIQHRADELAIEIPAVLRLLAERDYPGMQDVSCIERIAILGGLLGHRTRRCHKAAWLLATHEINDRAREYDYLFSDGRVSASSGTPEPMQVQKIAELDFDAIDHGVRLDQGADLISHIANGLKNLLRQL
jgi:hypothetical protein